MVVVQGRNVDVHTRSDLAGVLETMLALKSRVSERRTCIAFRHSL